MVKAPEIPLNWSTVGIFRCVWPLARRHTGRRPNQERVLRDKVGTFQLLAYPAAFDFDIPACSVVSRFHSRGAAMFKGIALGIVLAIILGLGSAYIAVVSGAIPANADAEPGPIEQWLAGTSLEGTLNSQAPKEANPVALTEANLIDGIRLYGQHCAICHGSATGENSASWIAKGEYPAPPQLASDGVEDDAEGWTFWKIKHGIRLTGMPS